jgi:hypothetical protein
MAINVQPITVTDATEIIDSMVSLPMSIMIWGPPGTGKSEIVNQICERRGARLIDLRLSHKIASDIGGLPMVDHTTNTTRFARPTWFPIDDTEPTVLFLDELAGADPHTRIAAYGLLLERRIDEWTLPANCQVIAASNRTEDGAISAEFGSALNDRLLHLVVEPNLDAWIAWATENAIHPAIVAFLKTNPHHLAATPDTLNSGNAVLPSPRSWKRVSDALHIIERTKSLSKDARLAIVAGLIGKEVSYDFWAVHDEVFEMTPIADIIEAARKGDNRLYEMLPKKINQLYALGFGLATMINKKNADAVMRIVIALQEASTKVSSGEAMVFVGGLVCESAERRLLHDTMMLSPSFDRYSATMNSLRDAA